MIHYLHILTVVLLGLKLVGLVSISWWLVFAPSLFAVAFVTIVLVALWFVFRG